MHSSFLDTITEIAGERGIDPRRLVVEVSKKDIVNPSKSSIVEAASALAAAQSVQQHTTRPLLAKPSTVQSVSPKNLDAVLGQLTAAGKKKHLVTIFNIVQLYPLTGQPYASEAIHEEAELAMASAEVRSAEEAVALASIVKEEVDFILADLDIKTPESARIQRSISDSVPSDKVLPYSDLEVWGRSLVALSLELRFDHNRRREVRVLGRGPLAEIVRSGLRVLVQGTGSDGESPGPVVVVCEDAAPLSVMDFGTDAIVVDGLAESLGLEDYSALHVLQIPVYRPNMAPFVCNEARGLIMVRQAVRQRIGLGRVVDVDIAAGGIVAPRGYVIVDSVAMPRKVYGVADGTGCLIQSGELTPADLQRIDRVERYCVLGES
jgi:hypothetical protein